MTKSTKKVKKISNINSSDDSSSDDSDDSDDTDNSDSDDEQNKCMVKISDKITLKHIDITIKHGEFVAVIGEVGSGKTSLISSLIGDMLQVDGYTFNKFKDLEIYDTRGEVDADHREKLALMNHEKFEKFQITRKRFSGQPRIQMDGSVSLMEQTPWILNETIRENILFGEKLNVLKYNNVIETCQLARDLEILDGGDLTQIGEKGINLSGGQKARVSIARAVYADKDIVLMDDPLSALDAHVKKSIFEEV